MPIPNLAVQLTANATPLLQSIDQVKERIKTLQNALIVGDQRNDVFKKTVEDLKDAQASLRYFESLARSSAAKVENNVNQVRSSFGRASLGVQGFTRVIQDLPYGFIGIANNLQELPNAFVQIQKAAKESGQTITSTIVSSLTGPAGLGLAISLVTSAITFATYGFEAWTRGFGKGKQEVDDYNEEIKNLIKSIRDIPRIKIDAQADVDGEIAKVNALKEVIANANKPYADRARALKELQEINESYFGDLTLEAAKYDTLTDRISKYTDALYTNAVVSGIQEDIKNTSKALRLEEQSLVGLKDKWEKLNNVYEATKKLRLSGIVKGEGFGSEVGIAKREADNALKSFKETQKNVETLRIKELQFRNELRDNIEKQSSYKPLKLDKNDGTEELDNLIKKIKNLIEKAKEEGFELPPIKLATDKKGLQDQFEFLTKEYQKLKDKFKDFKDLLNLNEKFSDKNVDSRIELLKKQIEDARKSVELLAKEKDNLFANQSDDNLGLRINVETNYRDQLAQYKNLQNELLALSLDRIKKERDAAIESALKLSSVTNKDVIREISGVYAEYDRRVQSAQTEESLNKLAQWKDAAIKSALETGGEISAILINTLNAIGETFKKNTLKLKVELQVIAPKKAYGGVESNKDSIVNTEKGVNKFSSINEELNKRQQELEDSQKTVKDFWDALGVEYKNGYLNFNKIVGTGLSETLSNFGQAFSETGDIGKALAAGGETILHIIGAFLEQLGAQILIFGEVIKKLKLAITKAITNPVALAAVAGLMIIVGASLKNISLSKVPAFANGGIVTGPTLGLIGEAGKEAVIPLDRLGEIMGSSGGKQNVFVTGQLNGETIYLQQQRVVQRRGRLN